MKNKNAIQAIALALSLILASSAWSTVAAAENADTAAGRYDAEELMREAEMLAAEAHKLYTMAEEHDGGEAALSEIEAALEWIDEARHLIENDHLERAEEALHMAAKHLDLAKEIIYSSSTGSERDDGSERDRDRVDEEKDRYDEEKLEHFLAEVKAMMERAMKLQSEAEAQGHERALEVLDKAMHLIENAVEEAEYGNFGEAIGMLEEATKMLNAVQAMLSVVVTPAPTDREDMKERVIMEAKHMMEKAKRLSAIAEEQGKEDVLEAIGKAMRMLEEVVELASNGEVKHAIEVLEEAAKILHRAALALGGSESFSDDEKPVDRVYDEPEKMLARIAEELEEKAKHIQAAAEEQGKKDAYEEAAVAIGLIEEAWILIEDASYDGAKSKLGAASDHLRKASEILHSYDNDNYDGDVTDAEKKKRIGDKHTITTERDRTLVAETADDILETRFVLDGNGYAVLKNRDAIPGSLYSSEILMGGITAEETGSGYHFVVDEVYIAASSVASVTSAADGTVELKSVEPWDVKARKGGKLFITRGTVEDTEGNTYRVMLRGHLTDVSSDGLVYKIDGRIHLASGELEGERNGWSFANLHYLAIASATA